MDASNHLYQDKLGHRRYTLASLREKIEDQFAQETQGRADILQDLDTHAKKLQAVTETAEYILATEYINLPTAEKQQIIQQALANLFYFGELDPFLRDTEITEIILESFQTALIRRGWGDMEKITPPCLNLPHLERLLTTLITPAKTQLLTEHPFLEVGVSIHNRPVRVSLIAPPINPMYSVQIRLHPPQPYTLADFSPEMLPPQMADFLTQGLQAGKGLLVTGEVGVGKTTLINALLTASQIQTYTVVERAREMHLPETVNRLAAIPPNPPDQTPVEFEAQIQAALATATTSTLVLDEIRGDESTAFWSALTAPPQLIIAFRGTSQPRRLLSALGMVIRKRTPNLDSAELNAAILAKLPYVVVLHREKSGTPPHVSLLGQWQMSENTLTLEPVQF